LTVFENHDSILMLFVAPATTTAQNRLHKSLLTQSACDWRVLV